MTFCNVSPTLPKRANPKIKLIFGGSILFFVLSLGIQAYSSSYIAVKGKTAATLIDQKVQLEKQLSETNLKIAQLSALSYIQAKASELGFVKYASFVQVISPVSKNTASAPTL